VPTTSRRRFLSECVAAAGILPAVSRGLRVSRPRLRFPSEPKARIAVSSYSFRAFIPGEEHEGGNPTVELKDFAAHVAWKFGVHNVEPWSAHFPSTDRGYLDEFRAAVVKAQSAVVDIAVDGHDSQYSTDGAERARAVTFSKLWVDVAAALGSPSIRTNIPEAKDSKPDVARTADTLLRVVEYSARKDVVVHLENDDPVSEDPFFIAQVIDKVASPWLHALPDFGNSLATHSEDYAYRGMETMFAHAYGICHVKDGEVDERGKPVHVDLARTFGILRAHGYRGYCSIEYDSPGDPYQATAKLVEETVQYLS
jgi:sugar phosphate isomerase/epimerase